MTVSVEILDDFAANAAARLGAELGAAHSIILTGGTTAADIYERLAPGSLRPGATVFFSDERCVAPDDAASNYGMAAARLAFTPDLSVHRMRGEDDPDLAAAEYHQALLPWVERGIDVALLGLGADCHVAALFPGSPALEPGERLCAAVERPDGMGGLTLTPEALSLAARVFVLVRGRPKAQAVSRLLEGDEPVRDCPAGLLRELSEVTVLADREALGSP